MKVDHKIKNVSYEKNNKTWCILNHTLYSYIN
jgi:hypothetical protein